jgi:carbonic anhydrase/acetyltransferase-like protein (isoleucine patch superfamily)
MTRIVNSTVAPDAQIGDGVQIVDSKIEAGVVICDQSRLHRVHVGRGSVVGRLCTLKEGVRVGSGVTIGDLCLIKPYAIIRDGAVLPEGTVVDPYQRYPYNPRPSPMQAEADA